MHCTDETIKCDGVLEEPFWREAEATEVFLQLGKLSDAINGLWLAPDGSPVGTTAKIVAGPDALYVAIIAPYAADKKPVVQQCEGGEIWQDDCVEFFVDPAGTGFFQILANANGAKFCAQYGVGDTKLQKWETSTNSGGTLDAEKFVVELSIPYRDLGMERPQRGEIWRGNFAREGRSGDGLSSWAPVGDQFLAPERFGSFLFGSRREAAQMLSEDRYNRTVPLRTLAEPVAQDAITSVDALLKLAETLTDTATAFDNFLSTLAETDRKIALAAFAGRSCVIRQFGNEETLPQPNDPLPSVMEECKKLSLKVPQGGFAQATLAISNLTDKTILVRADLVALADSPAIPTETVRIQELIPFEIGGGQLVPDALTDLPLHSMLRLNAQTQTCISVSIDTRKLVPGTYQAVLKISPVYDGMEKSELPITLTILDINLEKIPVWIWSYGYRPQPWSVPLLAEYGFNVINPTPEYFLPVYDKGDGTPRFDALDAMLQAMEENGISREDILVLCYPEFSLWAEIRNRAGKKLEFLSPEWKQVYGEGLRLLRDHLHEQWGISYDRLLFYITDEPSGDPADPETRAYVAFEGGKFIKSVDPQFRTMTNPYQLNDGREQMYFDNFDVLSPFLPQLTEELAEKYANSGREIWSYSILLKTNSPKQYRRIFWQHLQNGFTGTATVYDLFDASGDMFDSRDGGQSTADYGMAYRNYPMQKILPSRRLNAYRQGIADYRLAKWCQQKIAGSPEIQEEYEAIVAEGVTGNMDVAGIRLIALAEKLLQQENGK